MSFKTTCFNRYIVECKSSHKKEGELVDKRFNRYIVECKYITVGTINGKQIVLIDT